MDPCPARTNATQDRELAIHAESTPAELRGDMGR